MAAMACLAPVKRQLAAWYQTAVVLHAGITTAARIAAPAAAVCAIVKRSEVLGVTPPDTLHANKEQTFSIVATLTVQGQQCWLPRVWLHITGCCCGRHRHFRQWPTTITAANRLQQEQRCSLPTCQGGGRRRGIERQRTRKCLALSSC